MKDQESGTYVEEQTQTGTGLKASKITHVSVSPNKPSKDRLTSQSNARETNGSSIATENKKPKIPGLADKINAIAESKKKLLAQEGANDAILQLTDTVSQGTQHRMSTGNVRHSVQFQKKERNEREADHAEISSFPEEKSPQRTQKNSKMKINTGDTLPAHENYLIKQHTHLSKSMYDSADVGSHLHEVLKPKGIEIHSLSLNETDNNTPCSKIDK